MQKKTDSRQSKEKMKEREVGRGGGGRREGVFTDSLTINFKCRASSRLDFFQQFKVLPQWLLGTIMILPYCSNMATNVSQLTYSYPTIQKKRRRFCFMDCPTTCQQDLLSCPGLSSQTNHVGQQFRYSNCFKLIKAQPLGSGNLTKTTWLGIEGWLPKENQERKWILDRQEIQSQQETILRVAPWSLPI